MLIINGVTSSKRKVLVIIRENNQQSNLEAMRMTSKSGDLHRWPSYSANAIRGRQLLK